MCPILGFSHPNPRIRTPQFSDSVIIRSLPNPRIRPLLVLQNQPPQHKLRHLRKLRHLAIAIAIASFPVPPRISLPSRVACSSSSRDSGTTTSTRRSALKGSWRELPRPLSLLPLPPVLSRQHRPGQRSRTTIPAKPSRDHLQVSSTSQPSPHRSRIVPPTGTSSGAMPGRSSSC